MVSTKGMETWLIVALWVLHIYPAELWWALLYASKGFQEALEFLDWWPENRDIKYVRWKVGRMDCSFETLGCLLGGRHEAEIIAGKCTVYLGCQFQGRHYTRAGYCQLQQGSWWAWHDREGCKLYFYPVLIQYTGFLGWRGSSWSKEHCGLSPGGLCLISAVGLLLVVGSEILTLSCNGGHLTVWWRPQRC